jgi:hypothetical protein
MIRVQCFSKDRHGAKVEGLGLGVSALVLVQLREGFEAGSGIDLIVPQVLFCPGEYFFLKLHRLLITALLHEGLRLLLPLLNLRWLGATALSFAGLRSHRLRLSSTQQKAGEVDAAL